MWLLFCCLYKEFFFYKIFNVCPFDYTDAVGSGTVGPENRLTTPVGCSVVAPTDRPKSVPNRCVIEFVVANFLCCYFSRLSFLLV